MLHLPVLTLGTVACAPLALVPLPFLLFCAVRSQRLLALATALATLPLLCVATGPGLLAGAVVAALVLRGLASPASLQLHARLALLWWPATLLQDPGAVPDVWPQLVWLALAGLAGTLALTSALHPNHRWGLALILAVLPFAPAHDALLQPLHLTAELPLPQVAARWLYTGPGELPTTGLPTFWHAAGDLARASQVAAVLLTWALTVRKSSSVRWVRWLPAVGLALLAGQTGLVAGHTVHPVGHPTVPAALGSWSVAPLALAVARIGSLLLLLRAASVPDSPSPDTSRWSDAAGASAAAALAVLAATAAAVLGPSWIIDPASVLLLALVLAARATSPDRSRVVAHAAAVVQAAAAAALLGGAWAGLSAGSRLLP